MTGTDEAALTFRPINCSENVLVGCFLAFKGALHFQGVCVSRVLAFFDIVFLFPGI